MRPSLVIAFALLFSGATYALEILEIDTTRDEVILSHEKDRTWVAGDRLCFYRDGKEVSCGQVVAISPKTAIVKIMKKTQGITEKKAYENKTGPFIELVFGSTEVKKTDVVRRQLPPVLDMKVLESENNKELIDGLVELRRSTASESEILGKEDLLYELPPTERDLDEDRKRNHGHLSTLSAGINYIFPMIHYQQSLFDSFALGVMPMYLTTPVGNGEMRGYGGFLTINRYSIEDFHGDWLCLGIGYHMLSASNGTVTQEWKSPAVLLNFGWRWVWDSGVNFGLAFGVQYILSPTPPSSVVSFSGLLPSLALDFGFSF